MSISLSLPLSLSIAPPTNSPSASTASASAQISDSTSLSPTSQQPSSRPASSAPPASSDAPPTESSAPPPTSSAPETTPSSAAQSSTVLTTPSMTVSQTTVIATSNGQTITSVVQITSTIEAGATVVASSSDTGHRSSNTGAIVGGVVGGLAVLGLAVGALLWYRRRQKRGNEFDGDFDPARVGGRNSTLGPEMMQAGGGGTLPNLNLDEEDDGMGGRMPINGGIITPFAYAPTVSAYDASSRSQSPPMPRGSPPPLSQYSQDGVPYTPTMSSTGGYYAAVPQQAQAVGGYYPHTAPSSTSGSSAYGPRSAKEREAMSGSPSHVRAFSVANPGPSNEAGAYDENQIQAYLRSGPRRASQGDYPPMVSPHSPVASSSSGSGVGSGVIVHQDGGRVQENIQEADEIPPTYDSIPNDHEPRK